MTATPPASRPPAGTVYGRGGIDVKEAPRGLHPGVISLVIVAAVVSLLALAYYTLWHNPDGSPQRDTRAVAPAGAPESASPSAASPETSAAAPAFGTGRWRLTAGDADLVTDGEFAAMSTEKAMTLTVVSGLADRKCFSFRNPDGKYLRHFDYRLRFSPREDQELFRADATFCPEAEQPATALRLRSKNYPDHVIHRRGTELYIDKPDKSDSFADDSTFTATQP